MPGDASATGNAAAAASGGGGVSANVAELRAVAAQCRWRGLVRCSVWLSEQARGVMQDGPCAHVWRDPPTPGTAGSAAACTRGVPRREASRYLLAKSAFDCGELLRCYDLLKDRCASGKALFLRLYAYYMAGEEKRQAHIANREDATTVRNPYAEAVLAELDAPSRAALVAADPYLLWLRGVLLRHAKRLPEARVVLVEAVALQPLLWAAWQELLALGGVAAALRRCEQLGVGQHWVAQFAAARQHALGHRWERTVEVLGPLGRHMGKAPAILQQVASARRHLRQWRKSKDVFEYLLELQPYRFEGLVEYSNVLFLTRAQHQGELCQLARRALKVAKYRPETCMVLADYHSAAERHEKTFEYYHRALRLDPLNSRDAHILMGHEAIEIKATGPAVAAYRAAVAAPARQREILGPDAACSEDIMKHCASGWYAVGMSYELLRLPCLTLHHHVRAAQQPATQADQQPFWEGVAVMCEEVGLVDEAVRCHHRRAATPETWLHLARVARRRNKVQAASEWYAQYLNTVQMTDQAEDSCHEALLVVALSRKQEAEAHLSSGQPAELVYEHLRYAKDACARITLCGPSVETITEPGAPGGGGGGGGSGWAGRNQAAHSTLSPQQVFDAAEALDAALDALCAAHGIEVVGTPVPSSHRKQVDEEWEREQEQVTPGGANRKLLL